MDKPKHGGKRDNAGRKPVEDKKITLAIYPRKSRVDLLGVQEAKEIAVNAIEKAYRKAAKKTE
jgi:hypothetical protein